ncbi:PH domain-containing protein [Paenarthrobacter sp. Z7-10]|uniref:PH domain-containing protein n=1 Tax=Paenarthrobacter sp. Z7-10 TaxID=2787635 RepID=UPI0022A94389|nr:PH domain-containing protein [Paenarthrobacter sp. Z7-10]MCZ2404510.1 PH domain-containing protein [Paenarthrobacter sp. Z7-10]
MTTNPAVPEREEVFRPRTSKVLALLLWVLAGVAVASSAGAGRAGWSGVPLALTVAFAGYWLFWLPKVKIDDDGVTLVNPVRTIRVPWAALITVDTKFALRLVTPHGSFTAWAAPAPGVMGSYRAKPADVQGLPGSTYGPAGSMRPGDLRNSDSGAAAYLVRTRWSGMVEAGRIDVELTENAAINIDRHWLLLGIAGVLALAVVLTILLPG